MTEPTEPKPLRDRPLMPNLHHIAGEHRGELGPDPAEVVADSAVPAPGSDEVLAFVWRHLAPGYDH